MVAMWGSILTEPSTSCFFTRANPLMKEIALHRVARAPHGLSEIVSGAIALAAAQFEIAKRSEVERIPRQSLGISHRVDFLETAFRAFELCDCNRSVQRHD